MGYIEAERKASWLFSRGLGYEQCAVMPRCFPAGCEDHKAGPYPWSTHPLNTPHLNSMSCY